MKMATQADQLIAERKVLTDALSLCDRGAYPGTAAYAKAADAMAVLGAFDRAHPEVIIEIKARRSRRTIGHKDILGV